MKIWRPEEIAKRVIAVTGQVVQRALCHNTIGQVEQAEKIVIASSKPLPLSWTQHAHTGRPEIPLPRLAA